MPLAKSGFALPAVLAIVTILSGCATTPAAQAEVAGDALRHKNLDVLFATEFPVASMDEALKIASQSMAAGDIDKAIFFYVRALQFDTGNVRLLTHIGDIHMQRGDTVMARRAFSNAKSHDPEYAPARESLGLIYMQEGRNEDAIAELSVAIAGDGKRWRAHNALGIYADKQGDHTAAQAHYEIALTINPDAVHVLANLGYSKFLAGDVETAVERLYSAAHDKGFNAAWGNLAAIYADQGRYDDAVAAFGKVMTEANAYNAAGKIAMANGDLRQAYVLLSEAVSQSTTYFPAAEERLAKLRAGGAAAGLTPLLYMQQAESLE